MFKPAILATALLAAAVGSFVPARGSVNLLATSDDSAIYRYLRAEQKTNLIVADRDGSPHIMAYVPPPAQVRAVAKASAVPIENVALKAPPSVAKLNSQVAFNAPPISRAQAPPISLASHDPSSGPQLVALAGSQSFVPTSDLAKPEETLPTTTVNVHNAAWLYAHRFDTPAPDAKDDLNIPGIPVRSQVSSPFDIRSGAFHGVRSINGYSSVRVTVSIPCAVQHFAQGPGFNEVAGRQDTIDLETGYVYIGGWGAGPRGTAVDAGLQKSSAQAARDEYAFYFKYASNKPITSARFPCGGPDVVLEMYPVTGALLVFSATGVLEDGKLTTITIVQKTNPDDGWVPGGGSSDDGIILKRLVSIAQPSSWRAASNPLALTRFNSGTYFGIDGPKDPTPRFVWKTCEIGRVTPPRIVPNYQPWTAALTWSAAKSGIYLNWPPMGIFTAARGTCDAVGIFLRGSPA